MLFKLRVVISALLIVVLAGCGGDARNAAPVTGVVTSGGKPAANLIVRFQPVGKGDASNPEAGMGSYGKTDEEGRFEMLFSDDETAGAIVGEHTVIIDELTPPEQANDDAGGMGKPVPPSRIPLKWKDGSARFTVKEGENEANFQLDQ